MNEQLRARIKPGVKVKGVRRCSRWGASFEGATLVVASLLGDGEGFDAAGWLVAWEELEAGDVVIVDDAPPKCLAKPGDRVVALAAIRVASGMEPSGTVGDAGTVTEACHGDTFEINFDRTGWFASVDVRDHGRTWRFADEAAPAYPHRYEKGMRLVAGGTAKGFVESVDPDGGAHIHWTENAYHNNGKTNGPWSLSELGTHLKLDSPAFESINGIGGGTYAPATPIKIEIDGAKLAKDLSDFVNDEKVDNLAVALFREEKLDFITTKTEGRPAEFDRCLATAWRLAGIEVRRGFRERAAKLLGGK